MNKLNVFVKENYKMAIGLKENFIQLEKNDWDSMTVLTELYVQIGHLYNVLNDHKSIVEQGRKIDNLGDEISDVLLQLSYLAYLEKVDFKKASTYAKFPYDEIDGLSVLGGQLTEAIMEKYEYRFDKPREGFKSIDDFIKDRIIKMMVIALNIGTRNGIDLISEFKEMCSDANKFIAKRTA